MDTASVMRLALDMAGFDSTPPDSVVWVKGDKIRSALFCIDASAAEVVLAKELGYDLLIAHHPVGPARLGFPQVAKRHFDFMVEKGVPRSIARRETDALVEKLEVRS
ncbi:MAG TPA: Nif3-like dinuclear metal center hexameric protein, partial [Nitrososphaerales archaeon]|nr:Nif3-like dinuclear metal center hexameric protein [Nitrososphaerales archaeon]